MGGGRGRGGGGGRERKKHRRKKEEENENRTYDRSGNISRNTSRSARREMFPSPQRRVSVLEAFSVSGVHWDSTGRSVQQTMGMHNVRFLAIFACCTSTSIPDSLSLSFSAPYWACGVPSERSRRVCCAKCYKS